MPRRAARKLLHSGLRICFGFRISDFGFLPTLGLALGLAGFSASAFVYETPTEFQADGDFDGNGHSDVLLVDKTTGGYRIAYQLPPGNYTWAATRATGIENVSGLAVGRLTATSRDAFIATAPEANRLNLLDAPAPASVPVPVPIHIGSLGPNLVAAIDIGGAGNTALHDLFVGSLWNNGVPTRYTTLRNTNGVDFGVLADSAIASGMERANRFSIKTGATEVVGMIFRGATEVFRAYNLSSGSPTMVLYQTLPAGSEYVTGRFNPASALSQFLFYVPRTKDLVWRQVLEPSPGSFSFGPATTNKLGQSIWRVFVLTGGSSPRLLVLYGEGEAAEVFDFDGVRAPESLQTFAADPGEAFTGAGVLDGGHFMLFSGVAGSGLSSRFQTWNFNGTNFSAGNSGDLPYLGRLSASGNVLLFRYEPFVTNSPHLVRVLNAGDWTSQFRYTGAPPVVTVTAERYAGAADGLRNPTVTALGTNPPLAAFGLVNQYSNVISVFSLTPPAGDQVSEVKISPNPGHYNTAIQMTLTTTDPSHQAYFRLGSGSWQFYSTPVNLFTNVTVQFYAKPASGNAKSAIHSATYTFAETPSTLDSDDDGVPDFVELGRGLDPNGGADSDSDGYSDLEELVRGTDPLSAASAPTNSPRLEFKAVFDRAVTPRPYNGPANSIAYAAVGTPVRVYAVPGSLLASALVTNLALASVTNPAAHLTNIVVEPDDRLLVEATELHFDIITANPDKRLGRELVGLLPAPRFTPVQVAYTFGGGSLVTEANAWIVAASNAWAAASREIVKGDLTVRDTLTAALVERKIAQILVARGEPAGTNLTLFPFRSGDAGRSSVSRDTLLALEQETTNGLPAWRLETLYHTVSNLVETSGLTAIAHLRLVASEIFDICSTYNNTNPAAFVPPLDELRYFLDHCTYDSNYLARSTLSNFFASACSGAAAILAAVPPRPVTNVVLVATASVYGQPADSFQLHGTGTPVLLFKSDGSNYDLPDSFGIVPGSLLLVRGFADLTNPPSSLALEVIRVSLTSVPVASDSDLDGNLLVDTWEKLFFGSAQDPFGDWDGDGYANLQEMWEGSDPRDGLGVPPVPKAALAAPYVELIPDGAQLRLRFNWPTAYINRIRFGVKASPDLATPFADLPATGPVPVPPLPDTYELLVPAPAANSHFFYLSLSLP